MVIWFIKRLLNPAQYVNKKRFFIEVTYFNNRQNVLLIFVQMNHICVYKTYETFIEKS
jgi:hypothetical protein